MALSNPTPDAPVSENLTNEENRMLSSCEKIIRRDIQSFIEVGNALATIRNQRLYRGTHASFSRYVEDQFDFSKRRAEQIIQSSQVAGIIRSAKTFSLLPSCEGQVRYLTSIPTPKKQLEAWAEAVSTAPDGKISARHVKNIASKCRPTNRRPEPKNVKIRDIHRIFPALSKNPSRIERMAHERLARCWVSATDQEREAFLSELDPAITAKTTKGSR